MREVAPLEAVIRAREGDAAAFELLVHQHTASVYRLARAIVGETAAPDVVQEAFLAAWRDLPRLRDPDRFRPWLHRIAVNRCRSVLRARGRVREISIEGPAGIEAAGAGTMTLSADFRSLVEARSELAMAYGRLSVDHRTVLALHYAADLSIHEVAEILGVPSGTAKSRLNGALRAMRNKLGEESDGQARSLA
jgi:RNA polymerase sigma-70 factor (ECF subfamily)